MRFLSALLLVLGLCQAASAAPTFKLDAQVSKDHVELGESFTLGLVLSIDGNFTFAPSLEPLKLDGFQIQAGPQQSSQVSWINGVVKQQIIVQWQLVALKSGVLTLGPFKASANDAAQGVVVETAPEIKITVAKGQGLVLPPTPTPEPDGSMNQPQGQDELRGIKGDLGFPWARALGIALVFLLLLAFVLWFFLRPAKPKKIEIIRDPGQQALLELEKARRFLDAGDEEAYYKELARILRFYLRHRMRKPEKELTLHEAETYFKQALLKADPEKIELASMSIRRLEELLFGGMKAEVIDAVRLAPGFRETILALEKDAQWSELEMLKAELQRLAEVSAGFSRQEYLAEMARAFGAYREERDSSLGEEAMEAREKLALEELGPAASARLRYLLLSKRVPEDLDLEKLNKELQTFAGLIDKGELHGKREQEAKR